jgi:hypothetical protein
MRLARKTKMEALGIVPSAISDTRLMSLKPANLKLVPNATWDQIILKLKSTTSQRTAHITKPIKINST